MARRDFSDRVKLQAYERSGGLCECERCVATGRLPLIVGKIRYAHVQADFFAGPPTLANCEVRRVECDAPLTADDLSTIAKTKRIRTRHVGAHKSPHPMPCGRHSRRSKTMRHGIVPRLTLGQKIARMRAKRAIAPEPEDIFEIVDLETGEAVARCDSLHNARVAINDMALESYEIWVGDPRGQMIKIVSTEDNDSTGADVTPNASVDGRLAAWLSRGTPASDGSDVPAGNGG